MVFFENEAGKRLSDQSASGDAQQGGGGEVGLQDQPLFADRDIAHRRQVIEVEVARPRRRRAPPGSGATPRSASPARSGARAVRAAIAVFLRGSVFLRRASIALNFSSAWRRSSARYWSRF